jgi:hypothetical protein
MINTEQNVKRSPHSKKGEKALSLPKVVQVRNPVAQILDVQRVNQNSDPNIHISAIMAIG